ncbi:MAG: hypothetical protein ABI594_17680 [Ginsengibacter sp.]
MTLLTIGETTHFNLVYDDRYPIDAAIVAMAILNSCEKDLFKLAAYMPYAAGFGQDPFIPPRHKIDVQVINDPAGPAFSSADNNGFGPGRVSRIRVNPFSNPGVRITDDFANFVFVAEMAEILMVMYGWDAGSSQGEALSRVMAEELYPKSGSNWVNAWLGFGEPRPDFISKNELSLPNTFVRGDLDPIAYGCGILFIYFLRYQLGYGYDKICGAGGTLLSERYRHLTGQNDNPVLQVENLINKHFGKGPLNLPTNNPFPLLEGNDRKIILNFGKTTLFQLFLLQAGIARLRAFFNCPVKEYPYEEYAFTVTHRITASTLGIGFSSFQWKINGLSLFLAEEKDVSVVATVSIPNPQSPNQPVKQSRNFRFDYKVSTDYTSGSNTSILDITSVNFEGDYDIDISVEADELLTPSTPVTVTQNIIFSTRVISFGGSYQTDLENCKKEFEKSISQKMHGLQKSIIILKTLPDPPQPGYVVRLAKELYHIQNEIYTVATEDEELAKDISKYIFSETKIPDDIFLPIMQKIETNEINSLIKLLEMKLKQV